MTREDRSRRRRSSDDASTRTDDSPGNGKSQGIVRDQRGQEQPADKERAQRVAKSDKAE
jgi:hypothetical protein